MSIALAPPHISEGESVQGVVALLVGAVDWGKAIELPQ